MEDKKLTGYPSVDRPWLKYYSEEAINAPLPECTMYELLWQSNQEHLNHTALNYYGRKITYGQLFDQIEATAKAFSAAGVKQGDVVAICTVNTPEMVYSLYALNRLGAIANMIDPRTTVDGIRDYLLEAKAKLAMTIDVAYPAIEKAVVGTEVQSIIVVSPADSLPPVTKVLFRLKSKAPKLGAKAVTWKNFMQSGVGQTLVCPEYVKDTCCVMAHTGGTTGVPKCVMLSNDNINAMTTGYRHIGIPFERSHRFFNDLPPFIIYGLCFATHTTLCFGVEVILYPMFDSKGFPKQFAKYKPHHFCTVPDHLRYLCSSKITEKMDLSFFVTVAVGGDSLSTDLEEKMNHFLASHGCQYKTLKGFGMTELSSGAVTASPLVNAIGSVGAPLVINNIKIVDTDTQQELSYGQSGEIWISGPTIMLGYLDKPEETAKVIVTDQSGTRWIRTGDLGYLTEDGLLFHQGRLRRIYITVHEGQPAKIFPMLVEDVVKKSEQVSVCSVVGRKRDGSENYEAVAFVVKKDNGFSDAQLKEKLALLCKENLPTYMVPSEYCIVDELPLTASGKVDFRTLEIKARQNL